MANINPEWAPNQQDAEATDQELIKRAMDRGYTHEVYAEGGEYLLNLLVKPEADLDGRFRAFDIDECEWLHVNGWLFSIENA